MKFLKESIKMQKSWSCISAPNFMRLRIQAIIRVLCLTKRKLSADPWPATTDLTRALYLQDPLQMPKIRNRELQFKEGWISMMRIATSTSHETRNPHPSRPWTPSTTSRRSVLELLLWERTGIWWLVLGIIHVALTMSANPTVTIPSKAVNTSTNTRVICGKGLLLTMSILYSISFGSSLQNFLTLPFGDFMKLSKFCLPNRTRKRDFFRSQTISLSTWQALTKSTLRFSISEDGSSIKRISKW